MNESIYLRRIQIFSGLTEQNLQTIKPRILWRQYSKKDQILCQNEMSTRVYYIGAGKVRATAFSISGREISYEDLTDGAMFGELSAIDGQPRTTHVITLEHSIIGAMTAEDFRKTLYENPAAACAVLRQLSGMVRFLSERVYEFGAYDVNGRIRSQILRMARENMNGPNSARVDGLPTHREIASRICTHREAVSRELRELSSMGIIEQHNRELVIKDVDKLNQLILNHS